MKSLFECYSRILIDNHITDLKPAYMCEFDPVKYVEMVRLSGVESSMVYASDHNGNCYYPSRVGHVHAGCAGRDLFGDTVKLLAQSGIVPVAYHTVIYQNEPAATHPEWRCFSIAGPEPPRRYRFCCPNHPAYREFCRRQIAEILAYDVAGIFLDMTFWPLICACESCRKRYGHPLPDTLDWSDPAWVKFQRFREDSLAGFARELTDYAKRCRPGVAVTHQFSPVLHGWYLGQSSAIAAASDYASGDFYGGMLQQRFGCKVFAAYSRNKPFEFMTSRCTDLHDHTSTKSEEELFLSAGTTLAHGGAYLFIDAIDPAGTLYRPFYAKLHQNVARLEPFRKRVAALKPSLQAEVGLYFSLSSCVNEEKNGTPLAALQEANADNMAVRRNATLEEALGTAEILNRLHIPYRVVTDATTDFSGLKALIVPRALFMEPEEAERLRSFVSQGGTLIASGKTALYRRDGRSDGNFQLADLFHCDYSREDAGTVSYLTADGEFLFTRGAPAPLVRARDRSEVKGWVSLPDFPPGDPENYASIHSDPPGPVTEYAGWIEHTYGRGRAVWLYAGLLALRQYSQQSFGARLFARLLPAFVTQSVNLPVSAELTLLKSEDGGTLLLGIVNHQETLPVIALREVKLTVRIPGIALHCRRVSDGAPYPFIFGDGKLSLEIERLEHVELFEIKVKDV